MHRLLKRQLQRFLGSASAIPQELGGLFAAIDAAYEQNDEDRALLERSLELSSIELLQTNAELGAILEGLPDLFVRVASNGTVLDARGGPVSDAHLSGPARGRALEDVILEPLASRLREEVARVTDRQEAIRFVYQLSDQQHYEARVLPLHQHDEAMVVVRNVTDTVQAAEAERRRFEQEAKAEAMAEFAYSASHDLRAPLRAIEQLATWIEEDVGDSIAGEPLDNLRLLRARARRMDALIVALLDYARAGGREALTQDVDVAELVRGVVDVLAADRFDVVVPDPLPRFTTARAPLERVFLNLLGNAIKHHDRGAGRIVIGVSDEAHHYAFVVTDDGPGVPAHLRERAFRMFERFQRHEVAGSGMGLALIKKIVEAAGGSVRMEGAEPRGLCVRFTWPKIWR
jgi:signal transduction histidine kinase